MTAEDRKVLIESLQKKIFWPSVGWRFLDIFSITNFVVGTIFLLLRVTNSISTSIMYDLVIAGLIISFLYSVLLSFQKYPKESDMIVLIDAHNESGGLLMSVEEVSMGGWQPKNKNSMTTPDVEINFGNKPLILLVSFIFLFAAVKIPLSNLTRSKTAKMELSEISKSNEIKIDELEEAGLIEQERANELKEAIKNMQDKADGNDPSKTFETLDNLGNSIKRDTQKGINKLENDMSRLSNLKSLQKKLAEARQNPRKNTSALKKEIKKALNKKSLSGSLSKKMSEIAKSKGKTTKKSLSEASKELDQFIKSEQARLKKALKNLVKSRVIDRKTFEKLIKSGKLKKSTGDCKSNEQIIVTDKPSKQGNKGKSGKSGKSGNGKSGDGQSGNSKSSKGKSGNRKSEKETSGKYGSGGISKGGGPTPMSYHRPSAEYNLKFNTEGLPVSSELSLEDSRAIGIAISAPQENGNKSNSTASEKKWAEQTQRKRNSVLILPKYRSTVKKYFKRN